MASFFDFNKPKMLDMKKKINFSIERNDEQQMKSSSDQATPTASANPFVNPLVDSNTSGMAESWVELAPSRTSLCSSVDINMVFVDDKDKDSRLSPVSMQSPHVEFESLEQVKYKLVREMLPPGKNTDWIWDWSSRPENVPPKYGSECSSFHELPDSRTVRMRQYGSNLTTPPNSPEPELYQYLPYEPEPFFNVRVVFGFLVSNLFTFVVGAAVGFVVCRKVAKHREF